MIAILQLAHDVRTFLDSKPRAKSNSESISEALEFKIFLGGMPPNPLVRGCFAPALHAADCQWPDHLKSARYGPVFMHLGGNQLSAMNPAVYDTYVCHALFTFVGGDQLPAVNPAVYDTMYCSCM